MKQGFSLLELSIVLVIIGLLAGGVMTGQSLIRAAELRAVVTEYQRFLTANNAFRDKYQAVAGDMKNATSFWGKDNTNCASHSGTAATPGTCNGSGDGLVTAGAAGGTGEPFQFWKQLALAGLIEGTYSGLAGPGNIVEALPGTNVPTSKVTNGAWFFDTVGQYGDGNHFQLDYGSAFLFGKQLAAAKPIDYLLTPAEAWNVDSKLDDGKPAYGKVVAISWNVACSTANSGAPSATNYDASYRLSDSAARCALYFIKQ